MDVDYGVQLGSAVGAPQVNRYLGGSQRTEGSHPYVKGFFYTFFGFPSNLFKSDTITASDALIYLMSAAEGYTPPGDRQLKTEDVMGMGGVDSSFITGQTIDRNFSIQYRDYWKAPIFRIHRLWTSYINPYTGGATGADVKFSAGDYKGTCMVIQTKPVTKMESGAWSADDIIKIDFFDGVFPTTDIKSMYDANITDNSIVRPNVQYRFDGMPLDETNPDVLSKGLGLLKTINYGTDSSAAVYEKLLGSNVIQGL